MIRKLNGTVSTGGHLNIPIGSCSMEAFVDYTFYTGFLVHIGGWCIATVSFGPTRNYQSSACSRLFFVLEITPMKDWMWKSRMGLLKTPTRCELFLYLTSKTFRSCKTTMSTLVIIFATSLVASVAWWFLKDLIIRSSLDNIPGPRSPSLVVGEYDAFCEWASSLWSFQGILNDSSIDMRGGMYMTNLQINTQPCQGLVACSMYALATPIELNR